jgi:hypothetical protein
VNLLPDCIELFGVTKGEGFVMVKRIITKCDVKSTEQEDSDSDSDDEIEYYSDIVDNYFYNCFQLSPQQ